MEEIRIALLVRNPENRPLAAEAFDDAPRHWAVAFFDEAPPDAHVVVSDDESGDVRFQPSRSHSLIADIEQVLSNSQRPREIAVVGESCGTTTIALHLAYFLSKAGPTVLVESSPSRRGVAYRLGMDISARTWGSDEPIALPVAGGFKVCLAPREGVLDTGTIEAVSASASHAIVEPGLVVNREPDAGIFVVTPTYTQLRRAAEVIPTLPDIPWAVVVNETAPRSSVGKRAIAEVLGVEPTVELPFSPRLIDTERRTKLLTTRLGVWQYRLSRLATSVLEA